LLRTLYHLLSFLAQSDRSEQIKAVEVLSQHAATVETVFNHLVREALRDSVRERRISSAAVAAPFKERGGFVFYFDFFFLLLLFIVTIFHMFVFPLPCYCDSGFRGEMGDDTSPTIEERAVALPDVLSTLSNVIGCLNTAPTPSVGEDMFFLCVCAWS
jgi:hypothetical protein